MTTKPIDWTAFADRWLLGLRDQGLETGPIECGYDPVARRITAHIPVTDKILETLAWERYDDGDSHAVVTAWLAESVPDFRSHLLEARLPDGTVRWCTPEVAGSGMASPVTPVPPFLVLDNRVYPVTELPMAATFRPHASWGPREPIQAGYLRVEYGGQAFLAENDGCTGETEPDWASATPGSRLMDNDLVWRCMGRWRPANVAGPFRPMRKDSVCEYGPLRLHATKEGVYATPSGWAADATAAFVDRLAQRYVFPRPFLMLDGNGWRIHSVTFTRAQSDGCRTPIEWAETGS